VIRCLPPWLFLLLPAMAQGAEAQTGGKDFNFFYSFFQMIAALSIVVGLILLIFYLSTRFLRKIPALKPANQHIRVLEIKSMGPRKALILIEISGEYLLLSSSGDQLVLIKQINMLENIEPLDESVVLPSFLSVLKRASLYN